VDPGGDSRQAARSVGLHLVWLYLRLERGLPPNEADAAMRRAAKTKSSISKLARPSDLGALTVLDVVRAEPEKEYAAMVGRWAAQAWQAWAAHHDTVRAWASAA